MDPSSPNEPTSADRAPGADPVRVALLDLYDGKSNQGMRALHAHLDAADGRHDDRPVHVDVFDVRQQADVPDLGYDVYISTGGPGSPFVGEGTTWETRYFDWLGALWRHNETADPADRKHALFICYSFQLLGRHFEFGTVSERANRSFGIVPVHKTEAGREDPLLRTLPDPFWAADFRGWQVTHPEHARLQELGGALIACEDWQDAEAGGANEAPHRAVMGVRLSPEVVGVQFHPEADPDGMLAHFRKPERRAMVVEQYGRTKYERLLRRLDEMDALQQTHATVVPTFLRRAITKATVPA